MKLVKEKGSGFKKIDESKRESDVLSEKVVLSKEVNVGKLKTNDELGSSDGLKGIGVGQKAVVSMG